MGKIKKQTNPKMEKKGIHTKNNPLINGKSIICVGAALIIILNAVSPSKDDTIKDLDATQTITMEDQTNYLLDCLYDYNCKTQNQKEKMLTSELMKYVKQNNCTLDELHSSKEDLYKGIISNYTEMGYSLFEYTELDEALYNSTLENKRIMEAIKKYSKTYDVPEALLFGFVFANNSFDPYDIMNFSSWDSISSRQTVYNFESMEKEDLLKNKEHCHDSIEDQVKYAAMAFRQALKEADGTIYSENEKDALDYYLREKNLRNAKQRILTAALRYEDGFILSLPYKYDILHEYKEEINRRYINIVPTNLHKIIEPEIEFLLLRLEHDYNFFQEIMLS